MPRRPLTSSGRPSGASSRRSPRRLPGVIGVTVFLAGSVYMVARKGLFIQTDTVFIWVIAGLVALSLTDLRRYAPRLLIDWLPLAVLFILYDYSRNLSNWLGTPTHMSLQIKFDEFLFGKPLLTIRLQHWLHQTKAVRPWEYLLFGVYMTHFFMALVIAGFLWRFAYPRFRQFRTQVVILYTLGFATYVLYPADPPWIVSQKLHKLPVIYRTVFEVWAKLGLHTAGSIVEHGNELGNQLAAVPSMHAAVSLFIALFFWRTARWWLRIVLVVYPLAMAITLVYGGEHYFFDVVVGWFYAVSVFAGAAVLSHVRARRSRLSSARAPGLQPALVTAAADGELAGGS